LKSWGRVWSAPFFEEAEPHGSREKGFKRKRETPLRRKGKREEKPGGKGRKGCKEF